MTDPAEQTPFLVLLAQPERLDPMALARILAADRGTPVQDQVLLAKRSWGIVGEDLSEAEARELAGALRAADVECLVCTSSSLVELPEAEPVTNRDGLPDARPTLVAAAGITVTSTTTKTVKGGPSPGQKALGTAIMLSTGIPLNIGGKKRRVQKTETQQDLVFCLDLVYEAPLRRVRVVASEFDYSFLGARKLYQALGNCKLLLADIIGAAPDAWQNHGTQVLLQNQPVSTMGYGSIEDLDREERWLLTLRALDI